MLLGGQLCLSPFGGKAYDIRVAGATEEAESEAGHHLSIHRAIAVLDDGGDKDKEHTLCIVHSSLDETTERCTFHPHLYFDVHKFELPRMPIHPYKHRVS